MLTCNSTQKTNVSVVGDTSSLSAKCVLHAAKKENEVDSPRLKYHRQLRNDVIFSASELEPSSSEAVHPPADNLTAAYAPSATFKSYESMPGAAGGTTTEGGCCLDESVLEASINESFCSLVSEVARARRRRRREQLALGNSAEGERQRQDMERALQSLEEMQRENKERMQRVGAHLFGLRGKVPGDMSTSKGNKPLSFFLRTHSVGETPQYGTPKPSALERAMTLSLLPEPCMTFLTPLPIKHERDNSISLSLTSPLRRPHGSPIINKSSEAQVPGYRGDVIAPNRREPQSLMATSPTKELETKEKFGTEKKRPASHMGTSSLLKGFTAKEGGNSVCHSSSRPQGEKKSSGLDKFARFNSVANVGGNVQTLRLLDESKASKEKLTGGARSDIRKNSLMRTNGRSTSPPIIILTVDSRRNMNEEEARRLLSAEPIKHQDQYTRLATVRSDKHPPEGSTSKKHSLVETELKSPTAKKLSEAATKTVNEKPVPEAKSNGLSHTKKPQIAPVVLAAKKEKVEENCEVSFRSDLWSSRLPQAKFGGSAYTPLFAQGTKKKKPLNNVKSLTGASVSEPRSSKSTNGPSKTTVAASGEPKEKVPPQLGHRNDSSTSDVLNAVAADPGSRRRKTTYPTRVSLVRRDEALSVQEKTVHRELKNISPPLLSEEGSNTSQRGSGKHLIWREKTFLAFKHADSLVHDAYRPLSTDRPSASQVYTRKRTSVIEPRIAKQLVPFCTECGKRHVGEKVKFCAFCGHKRETVK